MEVRWLGTAAVEVVCGGKHLLIDPYFQKTPQARKRQNPAVEEAVLRADAILITHPHMDHFSDIRRIVRLAGAPVYVSPRGIDSAAKQRADTGTLRPIRAGMTLTVENAAQVRVWPSRHVQFDEALVKRVKRRAFLPWNFCRGLQVWCRTLAFPITDDDVFAFEITGEDKTLFVMGSANLREDVEYPTGADVLFFPYQGRSDLEEYSVPLVQRLQPKSIVLTHFDNAFPPISEHIDTASFRERFPNAREPECDKPMDL